jgi:hypothetical protein
MELFKNEGKLTELFAPSLLLLLYLEKKSILVGLSSSVILFDVAAPIV